MLLEELRRQVCDATLMLPKAGLVTWTSGNVSGRDPASGLVVIKPSGVRYEVMTPADMVVLDLDGRVVEGPLAPSVDAPTHLVYATGRTSAAGAHHSVHATRSPPASDPVYLTAIANEFSCPISGRLCPDRREESGGRSSAPSGQPAILMKNGVVTIGRPWPRQAAVMTETWPARCSTPLQMGQPGSPRRWRPPPRLSNAASAGRPPEGRAHAHRRSSPRRTTTQIRCPMVTTRPALPLVDIRQPTRSGGADRRAGGQLPCANDRADGAQTTAWCPST